MIVRPPERTRMNKKAPLLAAIFGGLALIFRLFSLLAAAFHNIQMSPAHTIHNASFISLGFTAAALTMIVLARRTGRKAKAGLTLVIITNAVFLTQLAAPGFAAEFFGGIFLILILLVLSIFPLVLLLHRPKPPKG